MSNQDSGKIIVWLVVIWSSVIAIVNYYDIDTGDSLNEMLEESV